MTLAVDPSRQRWILHVTGPNARGVWPRPFRIHIGSAHARLPVRGVGAVGSIPTRAGWPNARAGSACLARAP